MAVVGDDQNMSAAEIFQEMYQKKLIPKAAIPKWEEFGIELGFSYGEMEIVSQNAIQNSVQKCAMDMLSRWKQEAKKCDPATPEKLIKALQSIEQNRFAAQLQGALDRRTFDSEYGKEHRIATEIAPYWHDLGIELGVANLNSIKGQNNPTEYKFKEMLQNWLSKQTCSKREVYVKLYEALVEIKLNRAAYEFKNKVNETFNFCIG